MKPNYLSCILWLLLNLQNLAMAYNVSQMELPSDLYHDHDTAGHIFSGQFSLCWKSGWSPVCLAYYAGTMAKKKVTYFQHHKLLLAFLIFCTDILNLLWSMVDMVAYYHRVMTMMMIVMLCGEHKHFLELFTAVSTKVVAQKCKGVRDNADWYYG